MTFSELIGKEYLKTPYDEFYGDVVNVLGYEKVKKIVPFSVDEVREGYQKDKHLNTLKLDKWSYASGFARDIQDFREVFKVRYLDNPLRDLYHLNGVTCYSTSEGVCILKRCAIMMLEESEVK